MADNNNQSAHKQNWKYINLTATRVHPHTNTYIHTVIFRCAVFYCLLSYSIIGICRQNTMYQTSPWHFLLLLSLVVYAIKTKLLFFLIGWKAIWLPVCAYSKCLNVNKKAFIKSHFLYLTFGFTNANDNPKLQKFKQEHIILNNKGNSTQLHTILNITTDDGVITLSLPTVP